jgi:hypothetical protein
MIGDDKDIQMCRTCDAEFVVDGYNIDEPISFCPYCGSVMGEDHMEEEFYDEDNGF